MAITKDLECTVVVDGKDLQEFGTMEETENTISTYIEAQEGFRYGVRCKFKHTNISRIAAYLYVDGNHVESLCCDVDYVIDKAGSWKGDGMRERRDLIFGKTIIGKYDPEEPDLAHMVSKL